MDVVVLRSIEQSRVVFPDSNQVLDPLNLAMAAVDLASRQP